MLAAPIRETTSAAVEPNRYRYKSARPLEVAMTAIIRTASARTSSDIVAAKKQRLRSESGSVRLSISVPVVAEHKKGHADLASYVAERA